ncbi:hypothetical protein DX932_09090 [Bacillus cereus]|nr:hypothetical protein DX932_09090 [Bacillus cereus]KAB2502317.1 hypothetical protein F8156_19700 [Bacillus cereus]QHA20604.1 hypothetical protein GPA05_11850 [Bacillus toyonensis]
MVDTFEANLRERYLDASHYSLIVTGNLGHEIAYDLQHKHGTKVTSKYFQDCGILMYREGQPVIAGGSGPGCSATVVYVHLLPITSSGNALVHGCDGRSCKTPELSV